MADITMCARDECPRAEHCKRHPTSGTKPSSLQSWFAPNDAEVDINGCSRFWAALSRKDQA